MAVTWAAAMAAAEEQNAVSSSSGCRKQSKGRRVLYTVAMQHKQENLDQQVSRCDMSLNTPPMLAEAPAG
jgi:hypothetical protein